MPSPTPARSKRNAPPERTAPQAAAKKGKSPEPQPADVAIPVAKRPVSGSSQQPQLVRPSSEHAETQALAMGLGLDPDSIRIDIQRHLSFTLGRDNHSNSARHRYTAAVLATRDRLMERWKATHAAYYESDSKRGYYLSMEFLMGWLSRRSRVVAAGYLQVSKDGRRNHYMVNDGLSLRHPLEVHRRVKDLLELGR